MTKDQLLKDEIAEKELRVQQLLAAKSLAGVCFFKFMNFSWFTGGGTNRVVTGSEAGCAVILFLENRKYLISPSNEIERIMTEQVADQGFEPVTYYWYEKPIDLIRKLAGDKKLGTDLAQPGMELLGLELDRLRFSLTAGEIVKARELAEICSGAVAQGCLSVQSGITEYEIAAGVSQDLLAQGVRPAVMLVGTDQRVFTCRHPVPTAKKLDKYCLISIVGEKYGLHMTLTRSVHLGQLPAELIERMLKVIEVEAAMLVNTKLGTNSEVAFRAGVAAFAKVGYPDEWRNHHQGGAVGYGPREYRAGEGRVEEIYPNQMFGWNPTLQGTKSEETVLVQGNGAPAILTSVPKGWPVVTVSPAPGVTWERPLILER